MSLRQCRQEGGAPLPSLRRLRSTPSGPSNHGGALRHAAESVVALDTWAASTCRIDAFAVVPHPQAEFIVS
jgi:hypothetical protein